MQVIIPMSGNGSRFVAAGYQEIKPLIEVQGKPMIEWVVKMFPGETNFTFICQEDHLQKTSLAKVLRRIMPTGHIVPIAAHKKGPVYALTQVFDHINDREPCLVSYCDYYMHWDYARFKKTVVANACDGSVPCYVGFHPHLVPKKNLYANCRVNQDKYLLEIQEKHSFGNKFESYNSPGAYFFKDGQTMKHYCEQIIAENHHLNGEFYVSMVYELMLRDQKQIYVYDEIPHFCQWGTPEDLQDFNFWVNSLKGRL